VPRQRLGCLFEDVAAAPLYGPKILSGTSLKRASTRRLRGVREPELDDEADDVALGAEDRFGADTDRTKVAHQHGHAQPISRKMRFVVFRVQ
jgi:hypothetical protein